MEGLEVAKGIPGFRDHALKGEWKGYQAIRLSQSYRAIYRVRQDGAVRPVWIEEVTNMATRKSRSAMRYLETQLGGPVTLGAALSGLREAEDQSLAEFAKMLEVSRSYLCDIEQGSRAVSPERASRFAQALRQSEAQFVRLALQDQVRAAGLKLTVDVQAA